MKTYNYTIFQIDPELFKERKVEYTFERLDFAKKLGFDPKNPLRDYVEVYRDSVAEEDDLGIESVLEDIYETFNIARPEDFHGHSLSVSDIIQLDGKLYYCDFFGFAKL